jgi:hypothetical protein
MANSKKRKKAYSLIEIVVSLGIIGVVIIIFFNSLIIAIRVTFKSFARSNLREEMSNVTNLVIRDVRNADALISCSSGNTCTFIKDGKEYTWAICASEGGKICKTQGSEVVFETSDVLNVNSFNFEQGFSVVNNDVLRNNILFTLVGSHSNENMNINNLVRQTAISTRNYEF